MKFSFAHNNFNVVNLEKSLKFYEEALGLRRYAARRQRITVLFLCIWETGRQSMRWS